MTTPNEYHKIDSNEPVERMRSLFNNNDINIYLKTGDVYKKINKIIDIDENAFFFRKEDGGMQTRPIDNLYYARNSAVKQDGGKSRRIRKRRQQTKRRSLRRRGVNKRR